MPGLDPGSHTVSAKARGGLDCRDEPGNDDFIKRRVSMKTTQTRRRFLTTTLSLAGAAGLVRARPSVAGEGAPEITSVRIQKSPSICNAPRYVAEEFLHAEGFTDIRYVSVPSDTVYQAFMHGDFDFITDFAPLCVNAIDQGMAVTVLAGLHAGCFELFVNEDVHSIADLRVRLLGSMQ
jgi:NitT/TauT family transport system substrate-binding protein